VSLPASGSRPGASDEPLIAALVAERCPACGARLAPAAQWCGLCYTDLRPAPVPAPAAPAQPASEAVPARRPAAAPPVDPAIGAEPTVSTNIPTAVQPTAAGVTRPTWPCSSCGASVDVELDACSACGAPFLSALRHSSSGIELPVIGNLGRFSDRSRVVLGAAAGLLIAFILVVLTALLGR
jgi:hypothetical protein